MPYVSLYISTGAPSRASDGHRLGLVARRGRRRRRSHRLDVSISPSAVHRAGDLACVRARLSDDFNERLRQAGPGRHQHRLPVKVVVLDHKAPEAQRVRHRDHQDPDRGHSATIDSVLARGGTDDTPDFVKRFV
jgi:hypothetical protein